MASTKQPRRIKGKWIVTLLATLITAAALIVAAWISRPQPQINTPNPTAILPPSSSTTSGNTASPSPSSALTSTATSSSTPITLSSHLITVPSNTQDGVSLMAPTNGTYQITFVDGAYTTYQGSSWVTEIVIYKDKLIQWSNSPQPGP